MSTAAQHHHIGPHVVPLRAACDVMHFAVASPATVQQVAELAGKHILGVLGQ
jgi:hypothetical protein